MSRFAKLQMELTSDPLSVGYSPMTDTPGSRAALRGPVADLKRQPGTLFGLSRR